MTYRQYYIKLIKDLSYTETFNEERYQALIREKGFLDQEDKEAYSNMQASLTSLMNRCDRVAELITSNRIKSTDIIDPDVLRFFPTDIFQ